jgi:hypothetical protein
MGRPKGLVLKPSLKNEKFYPLPDFEIMVSLYCLINYAFSFLLLLAVLEVEFRASCFLGMHSNPILCFFSRYSLEIEPGFS